MAEPTGFSFPALLIARNEVLVVITYAEWEQRVLNVQAQRKMDS